MRKFLGILLMALLIITGTVPSYAATEQLPTPTYEPAYNYFYSTGLYENFGTLDNVMVFESPGMLYLMTGSDSVNDPDGKIEHIAFSLSGEAAKDKDSLEKFVTFSSYFVGDDGTEALLEAFSKVGLSGKKATEENPQVLNVPLKNSSAYVENQGNLIIFHIALDTNSKASEVKNFFMKNNNFKNVRIDNANNINFKSSDDTITFDYRNNLGIAVFGSPKDVIKNSNTIDSFIGYFLDDNGEIYSAIEKFINSKDTQKSYSYGEMTVLDFEKLEGGSISIIIKF